MDSPYTENACPACGDTDLYFKGFCPECGYDAQVDAVEEIDGVETVSLGRCPRCESSACWDDRMGYCYACNFDIINQDEETEEATPVGSNYDWLLDTWSKWTPPEPPGPYKPFGDLVEKMKKWPFFRLYNTDHWFNKLYCKATKWMHGRDVTEVPKAIGPLVFLPKWHFDTKHGYKVLAHEACHARDFWKFGVIPFFFMQYLLPFGPSGTALLEFRAYVESMKAEYEADGSLYKGDPARYANALASRGYRYCWPWPKLMEKWFQKAQDKIGV